MTPRLPKQITFDFSNVNDEASLPSARQLHEYFTANKTTNDWLQTVFFDNIIVRGKRWTPNRLGALFEPAPGRRIVASWGASKQVRHAMLRFDMRTPAGESALAKVFLWGLYISWCFQHSVCLG